jgi:hypothetical protein
MALVLVLNLALQSHYCYAPYNFTLDVQITQTIMNGKSFYGTAPSQFLYGAVETTENLNSCALYLDHWNGSSWVQFKLSSSSNNEQHQLH